MNSKEYYIYHVHIHKKDLYKLTFLVDAYDGMASYTTLPFKPHDWERRVELVVARGWENDLEKFIENISHEIFPIKSEIVFSNVVHKI